MKKAVLFFLLPFLGVTLSSCSNGFQMINEGDHGNVYSGGSTTQPIEKDEIDTFINAAKNKLSSEEYQKYNSKWSNVYLETTSKEKDDPTVYSTSVSLIKENTSLTSEIVTKGNEIKKNMIYSDARESNKVKLFIDSYISDKEAKHYSSEECSQNSSFEYLTSYYDSARMSYLDNMNYMLVNFTILYNLACVFNESLDTTLQCAYFYKGEAHIKQDNKSNIYKYYYFDLQHEQLDVRGSIYFTGEYNIQKLDVNYNDKVNRTSSKAYISLMAYDKNIKALSSNNRVAILPQDVEKIIH